MENLFEKRYEMEDEEIKKKEELTVNPFPDIIDNEEFEKTKKQGRAFLRDYFKEEQDKINEDLDNDHFWSAYMGKMDLNDLIDNLSEGMIKESYEHTIFSQDKTLMATTQNRKISIARKFFENIRSVDPEYDEKLNSYEIYECFKEDISGKTALEHIAAKKALFAAKKIKSDSSVDIISLDTGVFVKSDNIAEIIDPRLGAKDSIKPTHISLKKPGSREDMRQMMSEINGKIVEVDTAIAIGYRILKDREWLTQTKLVEIRLPIKHLSEEEINDFIKEHFEEGKNISGGIDYTSFGKGILLDPESLSEEDADILIGAPIRDIREEWAKAQIIKRAAMIEIMDNIDQEDEDFR